MILLRNVCAGAAHKTAQSLCKAEEIHVIVLYGSHIPTIIFEL